MDRFVYVVRDAVEGGVESKGDERCLKRVAVSSVPVSTRTVVLLVEDRPHEWIFGLFLSAICAAATAPP